MPFKEINIYSCRGSTSQPVKHEEAVIAVPLVFDTRHADLLFYNTQECSLKLPVIRGKIIECLTKAL
jgi:hypothetical protein